MNDATGGDASTGGTMSGAKIVVLNGPNLNRLGIRQPDVYGTTSLDDIVAACRSRAAAWGIDIEAYQSNSEGQLIDWVHRAADEAAAVVINPGGLTHTSVALRDALAEIADGAGFVEVHLSNVHAREPFRHHSFLSPIAVGVIAGLGAHGYLMAIDALAHRLRGTNALDDPAALSR